MNSRELYTDLLIKILANTIYEDPPCGRKQRFDLLARNNGKDWPSVAHSMVGILRLENLRDLTQRILDENTPGHFIETGVWRGGCCILMRGILAANEVRDRNIFVVDSFKGLPPPRSSQDFGDILYTFPELAVSETQVRANFEKYGLLDDQVVFVPGYFQDTLKDLDASPLALLRLDGDMYDSTYIALEHLYPRLSPGGFVIVDDYGAVKNCARAVTDYRTKHGIVEPLRQVDWTGVWWQRART